MVLKSPHRVQHVPEGPWRGPHKVLEDFRKSPEGPCRGP